MLSAFGTFSEGLAFAKLPSGAYTYVYTKGQAAFETETGGYGFPFNEGYAQMVSFDL